MELLSQVYEYAQVVQAFAMVVFVVAGAAAFTKYLFKK